jgi:hypothetical protein
MKAVDDNAEFEAFAAVHRRAVWDEVLASERKRSGKSDWGPSSCIEGLAFQSQVGKMLRERFVAA